MEKHDGLNHLSLFIAKSSLSPFYILQLNNQFYSYKSSALLNAKSVAMFSANPIEETP
jgi:hypothetical protein